MKPILASFLAVGLAAAVAPAHAQTLGTHIRPSGESYPYAASGQYDYARVLRVDPVIGGYGRQNAGTRCYERSEYVTGDRYDRGGYAQGGYRDGSGYYGRDAYRRNDGEYGRDAYRGDDGYYDRGYREPYGNDRGTQTGATIATVVGGLVGAVVGSQVGGGSARYATSALGSMVGGMAGRQVYEQVQRQRGSTGTVRVCDPIPDNGRSYATGDRAVTAYDVTYEYAGRRYTTRTDHHPGDRIRVRVDAQPD